MAKIKLTELQIKIRAEFRSAIIDCWSDKKKTLMFGIRYDVAEKLQMTDAEVQARMNEIPSIGHFLDLTPIHVWTAKYFKPISEALWDGRDKKYILALWAKIKRTKDVNPKIGIADIKDFNKINKSRKKIMALAELHKNKSDRWEKTSWSKVN